MSEKTIIFYSGKLWHSDKPFPVKPVYSVIFRSKCPRSYADTLSGYKRAVQTWLSTAYEVVNPEVIPKIVRGGVNMILLGWDTGNETLNEFSDGYHITLPEGYGVSKSDFHSDPKRRATITLPEKTDTGERYYNGTPEGSKTFPIGRTGHGFEPSESQEDTNEIWMQVCVECHAIEKVGVSAVMRILQEKFHITRRK